MQKVSDAYRTSMKSPLRERGYIKVTLNLVNQDVQNHIGYNVTNVEDNQKMSYISDKFCVFDEKEYSPALYATLEQNYFKVDGSMRFPCPESSEITYENTGVISDKLVSEQKFVVKLMTSIYPEPIKGLTINFGDNYPVDFDVVTPNETFEIRGNNQSVWHTEQILDIGQIILTFNTMKYPENRVRIYSILCGYKIVFDNDCITDSSLEDYISPISADLPQTDFSVTLQNYDKQFDVNNPDSVANFFETGQKISIEYGYQLPNSSQIEWIKGGNLNLSEWEIDDTSCTLKSQDKLRSMDGEYYKGDYYPSAKSYYTLAEEIFADADITDYYIDPCLKDMTTHLPVPRVSHKEALQLIANACCCTLSQTRSGKIQIKSDITDTDFKIERNDMTSTPKSIKQSSVSNIIVPFYKYSTITNSETYESLVSEDVQVSNEQVVTYYIDDPCYGYTLYLNDTQADTATAEIISRGCYYVKVQYHISGNYQMEVKGFKYRVIKKNWNLSVNIKGNTLKWDNPLVDNLHTAANLANWLKDYYKSDMEYEYDTRGFPEIDTGDIIYQENEFNPDMKVKVYKHTINFSQSFSGSMAVRKVRS